MSKLAQVQKELARRELARRRLLHFTKQTLPSYDAGWVHDDICRRLERFSSQVADQKSPRLLLLMPPRHGKSELASIRFPAWHLGHYPTHEIINVGYNMDLPTRFSRKVREVLREPIYGPLFPDTALDPDSQGAEAWLTTRGGGFTAAGVGGGITGKGAHVLIVDDPIKNQAEADSVLTRDTLWDWYLSTAYTRLAPGGGVLVIETWWHDDDLAGRLQLAARTDPLADQFEVVKYPALAEAFEYRRKTDLDIIRLPEPMADDPEFELLRKPGDCLHEARYPRDALLMYKANQSERIWSALYQQNPIPEEGAFFKKEWFKFQQVFPNPEGLFIYTAWDFAIGVKRTNDYTVGVTLMQDHLDNLYVLDVVRLKTDALGIADAIVRVAERWMTAPEGSPKPVYLLGFEDGQIWKSIEPFVLRRMAETRIFPNYEILKPLSDKLARAGPLQGRLQHGKLILPTEMPWKNDVVQEMLRFPAGVHDDIVDAMAWAVQLATRKDPPRLVVPPKPKSWRDKLGALIGQGGVGHMSA